MRIDWNYGVEADLECAVLAGQRLSGLRAHFHDEDQVTLVTSGRRSFLLPTGPITIGAGYGIRFPAGLVHAAQEIEPGCQCANYYLVPNEEQHGQSSTAIVFELDAATNLISSGFANEVAKVGNSEAVPLRGIETPTKVLETVALLTESDLPISDIARRLRISRETLSRAFSSSIGISPQTYRLIGRANRARALLRSGSDLASAAYESGFSDQSHMTRVFASAFGASPSAYQSSFK